MSRVKVLVASLTVLAVAVVTPPVSADTGAGGSTGLGFGALVAELDVGGGERETFVVCSGSLVAPDRFLTAGHCFTAIEDMFGESEWWMSFDEQLPPAANPDPRFPPVELDAAAFAASDPIPVISWQVNPAARVPGNGNPVFDDVAVATLDEQVTDRTPVTVAPVGALDQESLRGSTFDIVGYGVDALWSARANGLGGAPGAYSFDGRRATTSVTFRALTPTFLFGSQNVSAGAGSGSCASDSGAPVLMARAGSDQPVVVALAAWGDDRCRSLAGMQRLDTPEVAAFVADAVG